MEINPWEDRSYFKNILQSQAKSNGQSELISVVNLISQQGVENACNFMSTIVRVTITYKVEGQDELLYRSFIIKAPLSNTVVNEGILVENELKMYKDFLPKAQEISALSVAPKSYECPWTNCIVMEDLIDAGYVMCKPGTQLDLKQARACLVALAKFHAASIAVKRKNPDCVERNGQETVYTNEPIYAERFKPRILMRLFALATILKTVENCEKYGDILDDVDEEFWELMVATFKPGKFNVLNHGDFWKNNILFKYDAKGLVSDVKFIDYQMRRYGSPGIDLLYIFWTSADSGVRSRMYELVELYRHTLNNTLAELGCPERLSRNELKEEISKCSPLILLHCLYLPVLFPDPDCLYNSNEIQSTDECVLSHDFNVNPLLSPFKAQYYRSLLPEIFKELDNIKIFQILIKNKKER